MAKDNQQNLTDSNAIEEEIRREIRNHLFDYSLDYQKFTDQVRFFFFESQQHFYRDAFVSFIAKIMNRELLTETAKEEFWHQMALDMGIDRRIRTKWKTGESDAPLPLFLPYFARLGINCPPEIFANGLASVRSGIARTLTYIRAFPPGRPNSKISGHQKIPSDLKRCWEFTRRHVCYRKRGDLNQHAIDCVYRAFDGGIGVAPEEIGTIRRRIEDTPDDEDPMYWPWIIFKVATMEHIVIDTKPSENPHRWIWDFQHGLHDSLWQEGVFP